MRTFLAIPLPPPLREALAEAARGVSGLRAQRPDTIHLTIRFLGEIEDPRPVVRAVAPVAAARPPFDLVLEGLGVFPHPRSARVLWVGLAEGEEEARALAALVETALRPLEMHPEERPWRGHVTLGRFRSPGRVADGVLSPARSFGRARADRLVLYRSTLGREGADHEPVESLSLGGGM
ncbi:MAG: RNA 2',3'-cyclic phosphodiesterase [Planctomycetota bacterium]